MIAHKISLIALLALIAISAVQGVSADASSPVYASADDLYPQLDKKQGEQKVIVLLVEFQDLKHVLLISSIRNEVSQMSSYFYTVSYGEMFLTTTVNSNWYSLEANVSDYFDGSADIYASLRSFIEDAVELADQDVDFSAYDQVMVLHAGSPSLIGGSSYTLDGLGIQTDDNVTLNHVSVGAEFDRWMLLVHEYCHILGLPDLYDYTNYSTGGNYSGYVGPWDIMSNDYRYQTSSLASWNLIRLGWLPERSVMIVMPNETAKGAVHQLGTLSSTRFGAIKVPLDDGAYYLIESRFPVNYDEYMPDYGVLVTLVNESVEQGYGPLRVIDSSLETQTLDDATYDLRVGKLAVFLDADNNVAVVVLKLLSGQSGFGFSIEVTDYATGALALEASQYMLEAKEKITSLVFIYEIFGERTAIAEAFEIYSTGDFQGAYDQARSAMGIYWMDIGIRIAFFAAIAAIIVLSIVFRKKVKGALRRINKRIDPLAYPERLPDGRVRLH